MGNMVHFLLPQECSPQKHVRVILGYSRMADIYKLQPVGCKSRLMGWSFLVLMSKGSCGCLVSSRHLRRQEMGLRERFSQS